MMILSNLLALTGIASALTTGAGRGNLPPRSGGTSPGLSGLPRQRFLTRATPDGSSSKYADMSDIEIMDHLDQRHAEAMRAFNNNDTLISLEQWAGENMNHLPQAEKRQFQLALAGLFLSAVGSTSLNVLQALEKVIRHGFSDDAVIWQNKNQCRTYFETHAGGVNWIKTANKEKDLSANADDHTHWMNGVGWNDPATSDPPIHYFTDTDGIGTYSVQFTATDKTAWKGTDGTATCYFEGLCNPQYIFYRAGYNIVLNTWQSIGDVTSCQYTQGAQCKGLCDQGIKDQFSSGGLTWGGDCAIPCIEDGSGGTGTVNVPASKMI